MINLCKVNKCSLCFLKCVEVAGARLRGGGGGGGVINFFFTYLGRGSETGVVIKILVAQEKEIHVCT